MGDYTAFDIAFLVPACVALVAAFKTPERIRCAVSFAGVTDLEQLKIHARFFELGELSVARIQSGPALKENSPIRQVEKIGVPLLIVHGDADRSVRID
jgi:dipeptidyl aminopeptidase/acylaminoacyl peptidase